MASPLTGHGTAMPSVRELPSPTSSTESLETRNERDSSSQMLTRPIDRPGGNYRNARACVASTTSRPRSGRARRSPSRMPLRAALRSGTEVVEVLVGGQSRSLSSAVGEEEKSNGRSSSSSAAVTYAVHKELLTSASPFFAAALNGTFAEGLEQVVRLPEEKAEIFDWFLQWLYTGSLSVATEHAGLVAFTTNTSHSAYSSHSHPAYPAPDHHPHHSSRHRDLLDLQTRTDGDLRNHAGSPKYFLLLDLYALSDRLLASQLSNHILTTLARLSETTNSVPTPSDTFILYDTIRDNSPLRTLILDLFAYKKTDKLLETHKDEWHPRFLRDLVVKLKRPGAAGERVERHELVAWRPGQWVESRACEGCREVVKPGVSVDKCVECQKVFCGGCLRRSGYGGGVGGSGSGYAGWVGGLDTSGCKPWMGRGLCGRYHEHGEGEGCP
ncbi:hypothetical protein LTR62_001660 [Meristemomyces frigidus]|uniref:BTB domain-containing protein n=1 Tax=Meristemomyces frigidus TaxID=1508187 RepID=A0AAN7T890_9PEZI|nr:hypothetical protein LTR62_001660 [Meristemomyces frigidus]